MYLNVLHLDLRAKLFNKILLKWTFNFSLESIRYGNTAYGTISSV